MDVTVAVITITRNRGDSLFRCLESVSRQTYAGHIEHIVVGDDSAVLVSRASSIKGQYPCVVLKNVRTQDRAEEFMPVYVPSRLAFLRNVGLDLACADLICYLDDDNTYDPDHIDTLVGTIESEPGIDVAYSWRRLVNEDGTPFVSDQYPWTPEARLAYSQRELATFIFDELVAGGVRTRGSADVHDTLVDSRGQKVYTVDTNELMIRSHLHRQFRNVVFYEWREMVGDYSDDYAWVKRRHEAGTQFMASSHVSVNYTIGGVSNPFSRK